MGFDLHSLCTDCCSLDCAYDEADVDDEDGDNDKFNIDAATILVDVGGESGGESAVVFVSANEWLLP